MLLIVAIFTFSNPCSASTTTGSIVLLETRPPGSELPAIPPLSAAEAQLRELGVQVLVLEELETTALDETAEKARTIAEHRSARAVIWLQAAAHGTVVYVYDARGPRLRAREISVSAERAAAAEEVAVVIRSAVSALLEGSEPAMAEVRLPPSRPVKATRAPKSLQTSRLPPTSQDKDPLFRIGVGYLGAVHAAASGWDSGVTGSISLRPFGNRWFVAAAYSHIPTIVLEGDGVTTELRRHPLELVVGWAFTQDPVELAAEGALLVDRVVRSTRSAPSPLVPTGDRGRWIWASSTRLRGSVTIAPSVHAYSTIGADFLLNRFDYVIRRESGAEESVASLLPVRPRAELGLELDIW